VHVNFSLPASVQQSSFELATHVRAFVTAVAVLTSSLLVQNTAYAQEQLPFLEDREALEGLLGNALACRISEELLADLPRSQLYTSTAAGCLEAGALSTGFNDRFADAACQQPVRVSEIPQQLFCLDAFNTQTLGDGADLRTAAAHDQWLLTPGNRYEIGAARLAGLNQPYMQRVNYKQVETAEGICNLEMRIYKNSIAENGLKSIVAFHGGSWRARGFGFFGLEMTIPQLTAQGFVVFAPFYRLIDEREGTATCNNSDIESLKTDAADALDWVREHAAAYGASDLPTVFGQSAGGHLAASLLVNRPEDISSAVLFYPPTDFTEFGLRILDGSYTDEQGLGILQSVLGVEPQDLDISQSPIPENTFPAQILPAPQNFPPVFMLHGLADELVEATQSTRLCGALNGDIAGAGDRASWLATGESRVILDCGDQGSELHLIREGDHALDVCLTSNPLLSDLCQSGSGDSRELVADSVLTAVAWAADVADARAAQSLVAATTEDEESVVATDSIAPGNVTSVDETDVASDEDFSDTGVSNELDTDVSDGMTNGSVAEADDSDTTGVDDTDAIVEGSVEENPVDASGTESGSESGSESLLSYLLWGLSLKPGLRVAFNRTCLTPENPRYCRR